VRLAVSQISPFPGILVRGMGVIRDRVAKQTAPKSRAGKRDSE